MNAVDDFYPAWTEEEHELAERAAEELAEIAAEERAEIAEYGWGRFARDCEITYIALEQNVRAARERESDENRVRIYARLVELSSQLRQLVRDTEALTALDVDANQGSLVVDGLGEVTSSTAAQTTTWDRRGLVSQVVARAMDERDMVCDEEGNKLPVNVLGQRLADRIMECVAVDYGRIGACKEHGIDAKAYREFSGERRRTVRLPRARHE